MAIYPGAVATDSDLFIASNNTETNLTSALGVGETTIPVNDTTDFPSVGFITIDGEAMSYTGKTALTFTGVTRGADGTTAATHLITALVIQSVIAAHHNVLKEEIKALEIDVVKLDFGGTIGLASLIIGAGLVAPQGTLHILTSEASGPTPTTSADDLVIENATNVGLTLMGATQAEINFGDAASANVGGINYLHSANRITFRAAGTNSVFITGGPGLMVGGSGTLSTGMIAHFQKSSASLPTFSGSLQNGLLLENAGNVSLILGTGNSDVARVIFARTNNEEPASLSYNHAGGAGAGALNFTIEGTSALNLAASQAKFADGTDALPSISFINDVNTGMRRAGADNLRLISGGSLGIDLFATGINFHSPGGGGSVTVQSGKFTPIGDNVVSCGIAADRWSDVRSVLINGADYGFENGYILREYPCTADDVQTKSIEWMKANANQGIQVLNDLGEKICVIGRDGTVYAKQFKTLIELPA